MMRQHYTHFLRRSHSVTRWNGHSKHCHKSAVRNFSICEENSLRIQCLQSRSISLQNSSQHMTSIRHCLQNIFHSKIGNCRYSTNSQKLHVTIDNVLSESNKNRVSDYLSDNVKTVAGIWGKPTASSRKKISHAAVLVPLCTVGGEPSVLFTLRSTSLRRHKGQVSFPGGKMDDTDTDIVHTALRETEEELGIAMDTVDVWGRLMEIPSRDDARVTGVIGYCGEIDINKLILSEDEVDMVFTVTIEALCDLKNIRHTQFRTGHGYTMPLYLGAAHRIWGLTAFLMHHTLTILAPGLYRYKLRHRS